MQPIINYKQKIDEVGGLEAFVSANILELWKDLDDAKRKKDRKTISQILHLLLDWYSIKTKQRNYPEALRAGQSNDSDEDAFDRMIVATIIASFLNKSEQHYTILRELIQYLVENEDIRVDLANVTAHQLIQRPYDNYKNLETYKSLASLRRVLKVRLDDNLEALLNQKVNNFNEYEKQNRKRLVHDEVLKRLNEANAQDIWEYVIALEEVDDFKERVADIKQMYIDYSDSEHKHFDLEDSIKSFHLQIGFFVSDVIIFSEKLDLSEEYILELLRLTESFHSILSGIEFEDDEYESLQRAVIYWQERNTIISDFIKSYWVSEDDSEDDED